jgi:hypothetical protein
MQRKNRKKYLKFIIPIIVIILVFTILININSNSNNNSLYCILNDKSNNSKMELYFDYLNKEVYRVTIISTQEYTEDIKNNYSSYESEKENINKITGINEMIWHDEKNFVTVTECMLPIASSEEVKTICGIDKTNINKYSKKDLIKSFTIYGDSNSSFKCN